MFSEASVKTLVDAAKEGKEPLRQFLSKHSHVRDRELFMELAGRVSAGDPNGTRPDKEEFRVLVPSFVTSELKEAFQIGFLVYLPFIIIDMVIANVLLSMGMSMLSPSVVSLPFKLLLFVLADGWFLVVRGLVLSYA